jgi:hypothetical protein
VVKKIGQALIALVAMVAAGLWIAPAAAQAAGNPYNIRPYLDTLKCVDDPNSSTAQNTQMVIYSCNGAVNQDWWFLSSPSDPGGYWLENGASDKCLTVYGAKTTSNTPVIQYTCNDGNNEVWEPVYVKSQDSHDFYTWRPTNARTQCLTLQNASSANNTKLITYTCNGGSNQLFTWS